MAELHALESALVYIEQHYMEQMTLDDLIRVSGVSKYSLNRLFKKRFQMSPKRWIWIFRVAVAKQVFSCWPDLACRDVAFACGFETPAHFSRVFRAIVGETPQDYKNKLAEEKNSDLDDQAAITLFARRAFLNQELGLVDGFN